MKDWYERLGFEDDGENDEQGKITMTKNIYHRIVTQMVQSTSLIPRKSGVQVPPILQKNIKKILKSFAN